MWKEIFDYMVKLIELRFELTQSDDESIAQIARNGFETSISHLKGHVSPDQLIVIMERMVEWHFNGKLSADVRKLRTGIHWVEERYTEISQVPSQKPYFDKWNILRRIANLRERFDNGDFLLRLKIATGNSFDFGWEDEGEGRIYGYQKRLRSLASEVAENPELMTVAAWSVTTDEKSGHTWELIRFLGECDKNRHFLPKFESGIGDRVGNWRFANYCFGHHRADPLFVESYFDSLCKNSGADKASLLKAIEFIGPTPVNRSRLLQLIADKAVSPVDVSEAIFGRWLDNLPMSQATTVMDFIAQGDSWPERIAHVLNQYLYPEKPLPRELISFGERMLQQIEPTYDKAHECDHIAVGIAKTDLEKGFELLEKQIAVLNEIDLRGWRNVWNPFHRHGGSDFWSFLLSQNPERAYRSFCLLKNDHILKNDILNEDKALFDLENHSSILLKIAAENKNYPEQIAGTLMIMQAGFFPFAFELLSGRPTDGKIASQLSSTIIGGFGFGSPLEKERSALSAIEAQLKEAHIPNHGREWLERLRHNIKEAIKTSPWNSIDHEYLGWS
jgi:hypothetical protein